MQRPYLLPAIAFMAVAVCPAGAFAQRAALKTNVVYWATTTPNLSAEIALDKKTTLDLQLSYNPFRFGSRDSNHKIQHWLVMPEIRKWIYEKYDGHFFGIHGFFGSYNAGNVRLPLDVIPKLAHNRYEGYGVGAGFSYGYQWYISPHWNLEAQFGFGYAYLNYERYECHRCGEFIEKGHKHYFGPTKLGLSFIYLFNSK